MGTVNREEMFDLEMLRLYEKQCQVITDPVRFRIMIKNRGGLATAMQMLERPTPGDGFVRLLEKDRLDLSVEALVLKEPWCSLFSDEQLTVARSRLGQWQ